MNQRCLCTIVQIYPSQVFSTLNYDVIQTPGILISIGWLALNTSPVTLQSMQILLDIVQCNKTLPVPFVTHLLDFALNTDNDKMIDRVLAAVSKNTAYQPVVGNKANALLAKMKSEDDARNVRSLEKHLLLFQHSRTLLSSPDLCSIIDRLIHSTSHSSISYSSLDTRYILATIILNSLTSYDKYLKFLQQTWQSLARDMNGTNNLRQVAIAYAKHWENVWQTNATMDDVDALVKCLHDQYALVSKVIERMEFDQFQQWIEKTVRNIVSVSVAQAMDYLHQLHSLENPIGRPRRGRSPLPASPATAPDVGALHIE